MTTSSRTCSWMAALALLCGTLQAAESTTARPSADNPWGFCSSGEWRHEYPRFNPLMAEAGVRWHRGFPEWNSIQPGKGQWNWEGADQLVADLRANGMGATGCFTYFAKWATVAGDTRTLPLKDMDDWRTYVGAATERYRDDIRAWEVYNEFNGSFARSKDKPKDYAALVAATYDAVKAVDPGIRIGMSCANFDLGFFDRAIKEGAAGKFDFIAVHPYEILGTLRSGGESGYLSMAGSIRKMLADNQQTQDVGLWITEFGMLSTIKPNPELDAEQAEIIVKGHVLSLAQGFERICWFEARGPSYGHGTDLGVIRHDWSKRPCYESLKVMIAVLGAVPRYQGWLNIDDGGHGFVFEGADGPVLCAWAPEGPAKRTSFSTSVRHIDLMGQQTPLDANAPLELGNTPLYITGLPAELVTAARNNAGEPFPWGGDYATADAVSCLLGATNTDSGLSQTKLQTTAVVHGLDHSYRVSRHGGENVYAYFRADPQFAPFGTKDLEISVVVRRADPEKSVSVDITYESLTGYRETGKRWTVPGGEEWIEHSWTVNDANFVGGWGWNFRTQAGGPGTLAIKRVTVNRVGAER